MRICTVAEMIEAFADEERCRRLVEALVWPNGRVCPACGHKRSIALAGRASMGRWLGAARSVPVLQWRLPLPIHRDDAHAAALDQAAAEHLAQGVMADLAIGQGAVVHSPGRGAWGEPADSLADWTCLAPDAGAREPARRHGRDRRILSRRTAKEGQLDQLPPGRGRKVAAHHKAAGSGGGSPTQHNGAGAPAGDARAAVVANLLDG